MFPNSKALPVLHTYDATLKNDRALPIEYTMCILLDYTFFKVASYVHGTGKAKEFGNIAV